MTEQCVVCGRPESLAIYKNDPWCSGNCRNTYEAHQVAKAMEDKPMEGWQDTY